jgi:polysaccharide biosynthesis/export protein
LWGEMRIIRLFLLSITFIFLAFSWSVDDSYLLGAQDELDIFIFSTSDAGQLENIFPGKITRKISLNGYLELPRIGVLKASEKTIRELKETIAKKFEEYLFLPQVMISLIKAKNVPIYVVGQVKSPGVYYVNDGEESKKKFLHIIQKAGGFTDKADKSSIIVKRYNKSIPLNFSNYTKDYAPSHNITLQGGDNIVVQSALNTVYVLGSVKLPGAIRFSEEKSLMDYIAEAGGLNDSAGDELAVVTKLNKRDSIRRVKLNQLVRLPTTKLPISPGTIVFVPKGLIANWEFILRQLQNLRDTLYYPADISTQIRNLEQP